MFENFRTWIWPLWLAGALALSIPMFQRQLSAEHAHPFGKLLGLILIAAAIPVWLAVRRRWPRIELPLIAALALFPPLFCQPRATLTIALMTIVISGAGRQACVRFKIAPRGRIEELVISAGVGFSAWIVALMALGLAHALTAISVIIVLAVALLAGWRGILRLSRVIGEIFRGWNEPSAFAGIQTAFLALAILILQPVILTPCLLYDALAEHLAASRYYAIHHTLALMPFNGGYTLLPQGFELLMSGADLLAGQPAEQMIAPLFLALTLLTLYAVARELGLSRTVSLAASIFAISIPVVQWNGANVKNDIPLAFFLLTAILMYLRWSATRDFRWILASVFLCAACENVKHTGLLGVFALAILFLPAALQQRYRTGAIFAAIALFLLFGSFWMARSFAQTGDPLYPLLSKAGMPSALAGKPSLWNRISEIALLPVRLQFQYRPAFEGNSDARFGAFFLLFLPACLWIGRRDWTPTRLACLFFAAVYLLFWSVTWPVPRYAAVPIALLAVGLAAGLARALENATPALRAALLSVMVVSHLLNLVNMVGLSVDTTRLELMARRMDWDTFLRRAAPNMYPAVAWAHDHAPAQGLVLSIGIYSRAYFGDPGNVVCALEDGPYPPESIRRELAARNYSYVILPRSVAAEPVFGAPKTPEFADDYNAVFKLQ